MIPESVAAKAFCNCLAQQRGLEPAGHAASFEDALILEVPLPWKVTMTRQAGPLPPPIIDLLAAWMQRYRAGGGYPHRMLFIAPDAAYSRDGFRRVMHFTRPVEPFAQFDKAEYWVPVDEVGALAWALYEDRAALPSFARYRVADVERVRDLLVCTHGTIDAACGKFGYPAFKTLRETHAGDDLRIWRVSHFGGHVFAPTLIEMPAGRYWAYVQAEQAAQIARRTGEVAALRGHYRGWAGLEGGFLQAAECALWQQHGWAWLDYEKAGEVLAQDDAEDPGWAVVRLRYRAPDTVSERSATLRVEVTHWVETESSTGQAQTRRYPQYRVVPG